MRPRLLTVVFAAVFMTQLAYGKQLAVVTDAANPVAEMSSAELIKIFNLHTRSWGDGRTVVLVLRDPSSNEMHIALRKLFNMTASEASAFIQSHRGAIMVADSDDAVIRFVSATRGAIGVIDLYSLTKDVKVLKIDGKLPVEQGYLLKGE